MIYVNRATIYSSSRGAYRYYSGIKSSIESSIVECGLKLSNPISNRIFESTYVPTGGLLWSPTHRGSLLCERQIVTALDLINLDYVYTGFANGILRLYLKRLFSQSKVVVTISQATADAILNHMPFLSEKIRVIAGPNYVPIVASDVHIKENKKPYYILVTNQLPHKNNCYAISSFLNSKASLTHDLYIVGSVDENSQNLCCDKASIKFFAGLEDITLYSMIKNSAALIAPSLVEGLNLPIAEAISLATPVFCSDIPVHREFYEGSVTFFEISKPESLVNLFNEGDSLKPMPLRTPVTFANVAASYDKLFQEFS